jgi:hypothetical protein
MASPVTDVKLTFRFAIGTTRAASSRIPSAAIDKQVKFAASSPPQDQLPVHDPLFSGRKTGMLILPPAWVYLAQSRNSRTKSECPLHRPA